MSEAVIAEMHEHAENLFRDKSEAPDEKKTAEEEEEPKAFDKPLPIVYRNLAHQAYSSLPQQNYQMNYHPIILSENSHGFSTNLRAHPMLVSAVYASTVLFMLAKFARKL